MNREEKKRKNSVRIEYNYADGIAHWPSKTDPDPILHSIANELCEQFGFADPAAHLDFLYDAVEIIRSFSGATISNGRVDAPSDLSNFSEAKARLDRLANALDKFDEQLFSAERDALTEMLLKHLDDQGAIRKFRLASTELMRVLAQVDELEGRSGKPVTAEWIETLCIHCQKFWYEQKGGGTRIMFQFERQTKITPWVEAVFLRLTRALGKNTPVSALHGVAKRIAAYRP